VAVDVPYLIRRAARSHPATVAVDDGSRSWTLDELVARGERIANALDSRGIAPGAPVGVLTGNRAEYVEIDVALALARRIRVALNARLQQADFLYALADAGAVGLVHSAAFGEVAAVAREQLGLTTITLDADDDSGSLSFERLCAEGTPETVIRPGNPEDAAWITYTSGTTGRPKGIVLSHRSIAAVAFNLLLELGPVRPGERIVLTQPLSHGAGYFVLPWLLSGGGVYVERTFDPEEVQRISHLPDIRVLKLVPAMLPPLLETKGDFAYESIVYGASPIQLPILEASVERFGAILEQVYGQSEAPVTITCLHREHHVTGNQRTSAGHPWRNVAVEIRDEQGTPLPPGEVGEVTVSAPQLMTCYVGQPEATAAALADGWLRTQDVGMMDDRGFVYLLGRKDEMINSGGFNIAPREVELVLLECPGLEECAVLGMPDERWGAAVTAVVRPRVGSGITVESVLEFARPRLGFRTPKRIKIASSIPRNSYGKVDRTSLVALFDGDVVTSQRSTTMGVRSRRQP
jgi:acyl-CoA synthetase (AMP-forming)/AMP-acid ligase II